MNDIMNMVEYEASLFEENLFSELDVDALSDEFFESVSLDDEDWEMSF